MSRMLSSPTLSITRPRRMPTRNEPCWDLAVAASGTLAPARAGMHRDRCTTSQNGAQGLLQCPPRVSERRLRDTWSVSVSLGVAPTLAAGVFALMRTGRKAPEDGQTKRIAVKSPKPYTQRIGVCGSARCHKTRTTSQTPRLSPPSPPPHHRLFTQIERVMKINELSTITDDVIEAARSTLVIGIS
jgi:hypothetical protein